MDFDSLVKSLTEAIEDELDLRDSVEVDGMPAKTIRVSGKKATTERLHPKQVAIVRALLESGKTADEIATLLEYPLERIREIELETVLQSA